jgi:hypothetical protein
MAQEKAKSGSVIQIWSAPGPQGYVYRSHNPSQHRLVDHEGLMLVHTKRDKQTAKRSLTTEEAGKMPQK